jgi:transcriptional regulator with XRE-family HTH domain
MAVIMKTTSTGNRKVLKQLGALVRAERKKKGWSQIEMASKLSLTQGYLSKIEQGQLEIGFINFMTFCKITGIKDFERFLRLTSSK